MRKLLILLAFLLIFLTGCNQNAEVKITFIENGGIELEDLTIKTTDTSVELPTPVRAGYTFDGWFTDEDLTLPFTIASLLSQSGGLTLYAKWTEIINSFTITYDTNGASTIAPATYEAGTTVVVPSSPTKQGYTFGGWYSDEGLTTIYEFGVMPEEDITLYASWTINAYTITFNTNGGSAVDTVSADYQSNITAPTVPTKTGYTFVDWYTDSNLTTPFVFNQMGDNNITLYAKWSINQYTATFESNQGSTILPITVDYNTEISEPIAPTKEGYTFGGWYSDEAMTTSYIFTTPVVSSFTLYAKWNINSYTMTFDTMGGSPINPVTQNYATSITIPNPSKEGYDFAGWYSDQALTLAYSINTIPAANVTLYAKWTASPYTITFNSNGGSEVAPISANYNDVVTKPTDPTKEGHTFMGWFSDTELQVEFTFNTMPVGGVTLYAKWQVNPYTITFNTNGGLAIEPLVANFDSTITAPTTSKLGYTFNGWYLEDTLSTLYVFDKMGSANITLYAKWTAILYTIMFNSDNGSEVPPISGIIDSTITKPTDPTKEGHTFDGWYEESSLITPFAFDKMPLNGKTLYAKWLVNTYTLTAIIDGSLIEQEIAYQSQFTLPTPPDIEGYSFVGWLENDMPFNLSTMPARDVSVMPKYEANYYTISFGNIAYDSMLVKFADPIAMIEPTKTGYLFDGWFVDEFLLTEFVLTHMPAESITVYAKFEPLEISVYLHLNETDIETLLIPYEAKFEPETPIREGYQFLGWYLEDTFITRVYQIDMGLDPAHLYALWQVDSGYDLIEHVLFTEPSTPVLVKGIISYIFLRPGFPGFYLYDGTGSIFVLSDPAPFVVGDVIELEATYDNLENTPQLINPTMMTAATGSYTLPETVQMDIEGVMSLNESDPLVYGQRVTLEAFLGYNGNSFFLQAPFSVDVVLVNYRSIISDQVLMPYINQTVRLDAFIHDYQGMANTWHIAYIADSLNVVSLTPEEIIDQIIALGTNELEGKVFYPGAKLELPTLDPTYGTTLVWSTTGENSLYFDMVTHTFQITEIERQIGLQCVVTYQGTSETVVFTVTLKPDVLLSYQALIALENNGYAKIKAIVLAHIPMIPATIVSLDGNPIFIPNTEPLNPGDEAIFVGYKQSDMGMLKLANNPETVLVEVTQTGLPIPEPTLIPIETFTTLPGDNPLYWFKYVKLTGILQFDSNSGYYFITDGPYAVPLLVVDMNGNQALSMYQGMPVSITGFTVMSFDQGGSLHLAYLNLENDIEVAELDAQGKIDAIYFQLLNKFIHTFYHPGDTISFPTTDPLFNSTITFNHVNDSANFINLQTGLIVESIETFMAVELEVSITCDGLTQLFTLFIHIEPMIENKTIIEVQSMPITTTNLEVIVITEPINGFMIVGDSTGFMALYTQRNDIHIGDLIQIQGYLANPSDNIFTSDSGEPVTMIVSSGHVDPTTTSPLSLVEFLNLPLNILMYQYRRFELTGSVGFDSMANAYFLIDSGTLVFIQPTTPDGMMTLHMNLNREVTLKGYATGDPMGNQLMFMNQPFDIEVNQTNEMIVESIKQQMILMYDKTYRPGDEVIFEYSIVPYFPEISYVLLSNPSLFNEDFGLISGAITEITTIEFEVTILYGGVSTTFTLGLYVEPIVLTTIENIKLSPLGTEINLEAVVLFNSYDEMINYIVVGDDTGYMIITGKHFFDISDKVRFSGIVVEFEGEIALQVEAFNTTYLSSYNTIMTQPIPMTLFEAMQVDQTDPFMTYVVITGTVLRDTTAFTLYDDMTYEEVYFEDFYEHSVFYDYEGLKITIRAFIHYNDLKGAPVLYYSGGSKGIELAYTTDQEKMAALIEMGREHYEYRDYHPLETIEMPTYHPLFDAYLSYEILSNNNNFMDGVILYSEEISIISLQVTALIGTYEEIVIYTISVIPYSISDISNVVSYEDDSFVAIKGTVRAKDDLRAVIEDPTGMIVIEGFGGFGVGDIVVVYGYVNYVYGTVLVNAYGNDALAAVIDIDLSEPTLSTITLYDTAALDPNGASLSFYTTYHGVIENRDGIYFLNNGMYSIQLLDNNYDTYLLLGTLENQLVSINVYFLGIEQYGEILMTAMFTGMPLEYELLQLTDEEIATEILNYAVHYLDKPYHTEQVSSYPIEHPYFHGAISIINDGLFSNLVTFNQGMVMVSEVTQTTQTDITVVATYLGITYDEVLTITIAPYPIIDIETAQMAHLGELVFLKVMLTSMQFHYDTMVYFQDITGLGYFITMDDLIHPYIGYEVIISGYIYEPVGGISYMDQVTVHQILSPVTLGTPTQIQPESLILNGELNTSLLGEYITLTGLLTDDGMEISISIPGIQVILVGNVLQAYQNLKTSNGQIVQISGILVGYRVDFMTFQIIPLVGYIPLA